MTLLVPALMLIPLALGSIEPFLISQDYNEVCPQFSPDFLSIAYLQNQTRDLESSPLVGTLFVVVKGLPERYFISEDYFGMQWLKGNGKIMFWNQTSPGCL